MQKRSETVYSWVFWLISGLLVWLVIVPVALICFPVMLLVKAAGQALFNMPQPNPPQRQRKSQTNSESQSANAVQPLLNSLLVTTLIEVPAFVGAVVSLQPTKLITGEQVSTQRLQPPPATAQEKSSTDTVEVPAEE